MNRCLEPYLVKIEDPHDPRIVQFLEMKEAALKSQGEIIVDGKKVVKRLISTGIKVKSILGSYTDLKELQEKYSSAQTCQLLVAERPFLRDVFGCKIKWGLMAVAERPQDVALDQMDSKILILNGLNDAENVGAIIRSCHAFGITSVIVDEKSCSPFVRRSIRVSMGSVLKTKIYHAKDIVSDVKHLKSVGYKLIGTGNFADAVPVSNCDFPDHAALVIGNEDQGLSAEIVKECSLKVKIPVAQSIDSLNAACAASVLLYCFTNPYHTNPYQVAVHK